MTLHYIPIPAFQDNYIWVVTDGRHAIVIDPGDAVPVIEFCQKNELTISAVFLTHHHYDHVGGVGDLLSSECITSKTEVYGPALEIHKAGGQPVCGGATINIDCPRFQARVFDVPGHTVGHIAYYQEKGTDGVPHLFCGDALFASGCGRLFEGTPEQMLSSLDVLAALPDSTEVHCAHEYTLANIAFSRLCEPENASIEDWHVTAKALRSAGKQTVPTTIGHEKRVNPFLRTHEQSVRTKVIEKFGVKNPDRLTTFTYLRSWKDNFHE